MAYRYKRSAAKGKTKAGDGGGPGQELLMHQLFLHHPDGIAVVDNDGKFLVFNDAACGGLGYSRQEFSKLGLIDVAATRRPEELRSDLQQVLREGKAAFEARFRAREGSLRDVQVHLWSAEARGGAASYVVWRDRTEQRCTEEALQHSEETWKRIFEYAPDGYFVTDPAGTILYANRRAEELSRRGPSELAGMNVLDAALLFSGHAAKVRAVLEASARGEPTGPDEFLAVAKDGDRISLEISTYPVVIDGANLILCIARDNREHKRYEESLKRANAKLLALIHAMPDQVFFKDTEGRFVLVNRAVEEFAGRPAADLKGLTNADILPPETAASCDESDRWALESHGPIRVEERIGTEGEGERHFDVIKSAIRDERGGLAGLVLVARDMTERKRIEDALRKSEKFNRDILGSVDEGFLVIDREYRIISANKAYLTQVKLGMEEAIGRRCYEVSHGINRACHELGQDCSVKRTFETGEPSTAMHVHRDRDYDPVYVEIKSYPLKDEAGDTVAAIEIINNVTERKKLEQQLHHAQKLEAVGRLAGGIAHDFNNILTAIMGYGNIVKKQLSDDDPLRHDVAQILESAERAANLTRSLLTFSRKQVIRPCTVNVNDIVSSVEKLLRRVLVEEVEIAVSLSDTDLTVMADRGQLEQVLMNLATNARDAMPNGGVLSIRTDVAVLDREFIRVRGYGKPGTYARIRVADTGVGLDERTKARIFEPFFTTKETGKGTGLGLSIVYGIVKQHSGYITCDSTAAGGTTFDIYLPREKRMPEAPVLKDVGTAAGGTETILVVEDDLAVRRLVKGVLEHGGYSVVEASDGVEALAAYREHRERVSLLLLDVIMPKKNGKEVLQEIRKEWPGAKAIFMSGYTGDLMNGKGIPEEGENFLAKPVLPGALLAKVREALDGAAAAKPQPS
jgi:two-component system cell cycle sensor histidine kinase/response regulator CckA